MIPSRYLRNFWWFLFFAAICLPIFWKLDYITLRMWDESRLANNALELLENSNPLVITFENQPERWSTKPPLMIWLQAAFIKLLGPNEWAIRLPSALAGLGTVLLLIWFCLTQLKSRDIAWMTGLILVGCTGFVGMHVTRTGDYDALLTFFSTGMVLAFLTWHLSKLDKYLWMAAIMASLAVLTKSVQGLLLVPGMVLFSVLAGRIGALLRNSNFWWALIFSVFGFSWYFLAREYFDPGYIQSVWENDLGGRFGKTLDQHRHPFNYYWLLLLKEQMFPWFFFLPIAIWLGWRSPKQHIKQSIAFLSLSAIFYLGILSFSQTKLPWYTAPAIPLLCLATSIGLQEASGIWKGFSFFGKIPLLRLLIFGLIGWFYVVNLQTIATQKETDFHEWQTMQYGPFLRQLDEYDALVISSIGYNAHARFYEKAYAMQGRNIISQYTPNLKIGDQAIICEQKPHELLQLNFHFTELASYENCRLVRITGKKSS